MDGIPIHGPLVYDSYLYIFSRDLPGAQWVGTKTASTPSLHFENCDLPPMRKRIVRMATGMTTSENRLQSESEDDPGSRSCDFFTGPQFTSS